MSTIFKKIIDKEIPANVVYEDDDFMAFRDINPQAEVHILVIPKKEIANLNEATEEDALMLGKLQLLIAKIAKNEGIADDGYRVILNVNENGGQEVFHIHYHILGGGKIGVLNSNK
ncbi:histidine triad nucleotide-binding protein [Sebaldella sp. S0638]|uniref:histidine triad nucleotide-binding protein n=1 Tax=Sebaldella sp. S0638 TaxID=2957809 RepID=UPI0020A20476|nr:histidine triad nucleotide-binding protein [Sebaldella sp. S0638]MCP1225568.1 histidine triad nucleotide-binding protein [Sebaldella sp. S0638]